VPTTEHFRPNNAGIRALAKTHSMGLAMEHYGAKLHERAKEIAPVKTGDYRAGLTLQVGEWEGQMIARVNAKDWKSAILEFGGNVNTQNQEHSHSVLRHAAEQSGLRLEGRRL
jgi:hypothetical protein